tara:strand:- start:652 stop:1251 length:600 start_codon:yes stop_codon:yes gene_type:complete
MFSDKNRLFWDIIRKWESKGWSIGMHGYNHNLHKINLKNNFIKINNYAEFTELPLQLQREKIKFSQEIFKKNKIHPKLFIAPAHSFDLNTILALELETKIRIISDGISLNTFNFEKFTMIPQSLWDFKKSFFGIRTICLHPNNMNNKRLTKFVKNLEKNKRKIISFDDLSFAKRKKSIFDKIYRSFFYSKLIINRYIKQ